MYTEGAQTTGHHRFLQHNSSTSAPCPCQHCVHHEQPYGHHGLGYQAASARQTDHPALDCRRDIQAPRVKDVGGRAFSVDRVERSGHRSPQRRPVFAGPGPYSQLDDLSQVYPWELNPAQWSYPPEPGVGHYPTVREQCGCVVLNNARAHPFNTVIPHPLPHLQVKGQGYKQWRTVRYVSVDKEEEGYECTSENCHLEPHTPKPGHLPNGHCGQNSVFLEGGEERDIHQEKSRLKGGSQEGCNGCGSSQKGFFPTEVPQTNLNQSRQKGPCVPPSGGTTINPESSKSNCPTNNDHQRQSSEVAKQKKRRQDLVRDQIRQVVTDLEGVLGGLKQVHVEMKEVVDQIDRLTANIDLSEEALCVTRGPSNNFHGPAHPGDLRVAPLSNHKAAPLQVHFDEDRIILRTNSPSPVHMASVVKTSCFTPLGHSKDVNHERPGMNGHPPHLNPRRDSNHIGHPEHQPQSLDPSVVVGNSTSGLRTQKPPLYPQNGRCGKGPFPPPKPVRTPAYPGRARQSTSMV